MAIRKRVQRLTNTAKKSPERIAFNYNKVHEKTHLSITNSPKSNTNWFISNYLVAYIVHDIE